MAFLNPNFAEAGELPGLAANWTLTASSALEEVAGFGTAPETAWEDLERWYAFVGDFAGVPHVRAFFASATVAYESFGGGWDNSIFVEEFSEAQLELATLGPSSVEAFESSWSNATWLDEWSEGTSAAGLFDGEPLEDFEDQWHANEGYLYDWHWVLSSVAQFDGASSIIETFSGSWTAMPSM